MIIWFSASGNSYHAAQALAHRLGEDMLSLTELTWRGQYSLSPAADETLGLVLPVYFWGLPRIADDFLARLQIDAAQRPYTWLVLTCGGSACNAAAQARRHLPLDFAASVVMPDNYLLMYSAPHPDDAKIKLDKAEKQLSLIGGQLKNRRVQENVGCGPIDYLLSKSLYPSYLRGRKTAKFWASEACSGCGQCADICPERVIELQQGRPHWQAQQCQHCLACIQRCPTQAIQYGKGTLKRQRYIHPDFRQSDPGPRWSQQEAEKAAPQQ